MIIEAMLQDLRKAPAYPPIFELPNMPVKGESALRCSLDEVGADEPVRKPQDISRIFSGARGSVPEER